MRLDVYLVREVRVLFEVRPLRPVTERDCVAARRGGEQREVSGSSGASRTPIQPGRPVSLLGTDETRTRDERDARRAEGLGVKATTGAVRWWETEGSVDRTRKQGDRRGPRGCS